MKKRISAEEGFMKRSLSFALIASIAFAFCAAAFVVSACHTSAAADAGNTSADAAGVWTLVQSESGEEYAYNSVTGERIVKAYGFNEAGELAELDWDDYLWIKNSMPAAPAEALSTVTSEHVEGGAYSLNADVAAAYDYREGSTSVVKGATMKVTADYAGPVTITFVQQVSVEESFGGSISLNATLKKMIQLGASFDWNTSLQTATSAGVTYTIPSGKTGYINFTPYFNLTSGNLYDITVAPGYYHESNLGEVWGKSPKKLSSGLADGIYEVAYR